MRLDKDKSETEQGLRRNEDKSDLGSRLDGDDTCGQAVMTRSGSQSKDVEDAYIIKNQDTSSKADANSCLPADL